MRAKTPPNSVPISKAIRGGVFFRIIKITPNGTKNNQPLILKVASMLLRIDWVSASPEVSIVRPNTTKTISVTTSVGTVVSSIYLIWVNKSPPAMAGARFVVSLSGDILSPK